MTTQIEITAKKGTVAHKIVTDLLNGTNESYHCYNGIARPCYTSGSGRYTSNQDHTADVVRCLDEMNVKFEYGNDSTRGGKTGQWVKLC